MYFPLLQRLKIFIQALFNRAVHWLVQVVNRKILLKQPPPPTHTDMKHFPIIVQSPFKQEAKQDFHFEVPFYFLLGLYTELQPSSDKLCTAVAVGGYRGGFCEKTPKTSQCVTEPMPAGPKTDPPLPKAESMQQIWDNVFKINGKSPVQLQL